jgi:hypothetical protein
MRQVNYILPIISLIISIIALLITWRKFVRDRNYSDDKELTEQLKLSLKQAYDSVALNSGSEPAPTNDRLCWLTAARHISTYWSLFGRLRTDLYKTLCAEQEEFWRHRFYLLLKKIDSSAFFKSINQDSMLPEQIEPTSAAVLYSFSKWQKGKLDPLQGRSFEQLVNQYELFCPSCRHFQDYVERDFPGLAERVKNDSLKSKKERTD